VNQLETLTGSDWLHIGSTAVPGLMAKPIIVKMIRVDDGTKKQAIEALEQLGYETGGDLYSKTCFIMFRSPEPVTHTLHLISQSSLEFGEKLGFRDLLRSDAKVRDSYQHRKLKVSRRLRDDRKEYGRLKSNFIGSQLIKLT
jgi:GrpB-like predicted nucleotidyltransferase (UPF0157 family)